MKNIFALCLVVFAFSASAQTKIAATDALKHLSDSVTVCDQVYSARMSIHSDSSFLYLGGAWPNQLITVAMSSRTRSKFASNPEDYYQGRQICVSGRVTAFQGKPMIVVTDPAQIKAGK
jgi:DNA/RNA endonuclease YhcR with UshA esterase domain